MEVARGVVDGAVDVGAAAGGEESNLVGDLALVVGQPRTLLDVAGESEQRDLVFGFERLERGGSRVAQRAEKRLDRTAQVHHQGDGQRQLVAAEVGDLLRDSILVEHEVLMLEVAHHAPRLVLHRGLEQHQAYVDANARLALPLRGPIAPGGRRTKQERED